MHPVPAFGPANPLRDPARNRASSVRHMGVADDEPGALGALLIARRQEVADDATRRGRS